MFKTKKEVDLHVRTALAKLRSENEKNLRSFTIAKLYFKINEYSVAEQYVSSYLTIKDDNDQAHKLLGQCYQKQKKYDKALASFQRSLQLNPKQPDLLAEVCQLLVEDKALNTNKAKYWCDLAESEKVQHDSVFSLRLKLMNKDNLETNQVEDLIQKEIASRPQDVNLRIRLVRHFIEQNKILDAYKNTCHLEMVNHNMLAQSAEWYNVVWLVLSKYEQIPNTKKDWQFWCLLMCCLEQQVHISFTANTNLPNGGTTETANLLFNFDQYLYKASQIIDTLNQQKELVARFMEHYQGQLCLHAASLIFKRELIQNKNKWKETIKSALPLLLLAYQSEIPNTKELWMKHCDEHGKQLIQLWNREGSFRCAQAGRTLAACIEEKDNDSELNNILGNSSPWTSAEALISQIRQCCSDKNWRRGIFGQLFCNSDQKVKDQTSQLIKCAKLSEPIYELPTYAEIEQHEETAQYLNPQSLQHMVYLCLGNDNLAHVRAKFFSGLNFSTQNLSFCGAESLNQLDIETFLYASTLQAKRLVDVERRAFENYHAGTVPKPKVLPFVNIQYKLCTEEQINWWKAAYQVYKNLATENLSEIRSNLQYGIEAIRGINGPKMDTLIVFELGKIFETRAVDVNKPVEKGMLEARAENLYKYGLNMLKMSNKGVLEPFKRYFKYANSNSSSVEREVSTLAENAVSFLAARYFKKSEYEELIDELSGIQLPFATYLQAEAYRKLDEANKTPKKVKRVYLDKASECLNQTLQLLKSYNDPNHPLNAVIPFEMKRLQQNTNKFLNEQNVGNNSSSYEDAETEFGVNDSSPLYNGNNRSRREVSIVSPRTIDLENLVKQIANMMTCVKEELVENIKPEVVGLKKEVAHLKEKLAIIEENMTKKSNAPSRDEEASNVLDDLYIIEDELQNQMYSNQQQHQQQQMNMYASPYSQPHSIAPRMHTPTAVPPTVPAMNPYNNALYGNYAMNYYAQQLMMPQQQAAANVMGTHPSQIANRNPLGLSYMDSGMNFNLPALNPSSMMPTATDTRTSNLFGLLTQNTPQQQQQPQPQLGVPIQQQPPAPLPQPTIQGPPLQSITIPPKIQPSIPQVALPSVTVPPPATVPITFNKSLNNMPVEKGPPVNVVITSSDPLPTSSAGLQSQPTLSVTIPSHHIKPSLVSTNEQITAPPPTNTNFQMMGPTSSVTSSSYTSTSPFIMKYPAPLATTATSTTTSSPMAFSFKLPPPINSESLNKTNESNTSDLHKSEPEIEYDPRPDFQPIIPLPDEIEVKTGEENEDVMFCSRSKLFRFVNKEWKERGVGDMKILKNKENGTSRILMRRDQTHKICANHRITTELNLTKAKGSDKGYIWAANDFADEELKLEKFLVRFKHVEIAEKFEAAFNVARKEAEALKATNGNLENKPKSFGFGMPSSFTENKTSTPTAKVAFNNAPTTISSTLPKTLFDGLASKKSEETKTQQQSASPFANFSFDKTTPGASSETKPFANIFASINNTQAEPSPINFATPPIKAAETKQDTHNKSAENEDEYVPTAQFQPVIPLPDLVEVTTGEENETVLFEHRAKLLRFDKSTSEWKERGVGTIKVLQDKNDVNKVRLVMRREVIHKLCCNQRLYKDTSFKYMKDSKTALMWAGQDYSENELQVETLVIRFKSADVCKQFLDTILQAQAKMTNAANEENAKAEEPVKSAAPTAVAAKGFGDKFKPKAGSWSCEQCYTSNSADKLYCASCEAPKDDTVPKKDSLGTIKPLAKPAFSFGFGAVPSGTTTPLEFDKQNVQKTVGFGDKFKPKEGSWSCEQCYTSNSGDKLHCASCEAPKDKTVPKKESSSLPLNGGKSDFKFGFGAATAKPPALVPAQESKPTVVGFGDKFKPKSGSWSCTECYLSNNGDDMYCKACNAPKDSTVPRKEPVDVLASKTPSQKFSFGFPAAGNATATSTESKPEGVSFSFGKPQMGAIPSGGFSFGIPKESDSTNKTTSTKIFGISVPNTDYSNISSTGSFPVLLKAMFTLPNKASESVPDKGALTSTFSLDKKDFNFVMKPKSPGKAKSPFKATNPLGISADEDEEEEAAEEEENNTYFTPVIPLPDKVEVKTGEENEDVMFSHRAKLFRFTEGEWKERGLGDVKILRHQQTKKLRVVMRREQVLKICLNHVLNEDVIYKNKTDKCWLFVVNDYSEGEVELSKFCLRFKTKDIADAFMKAVNDCLEGKAEPIQTEEKAQADVSSSDKQLNKEVNISSDEKELADKLMLPYSFYDVSSMVSCPGCPGCDPDNFVFAKNLFEEEHTEEPLELVMENVRISNPRSFILNPSKLAEELTPTKPETPNASTGGLLSSNNTFANSTTPQSNNVTTVTNFSFTNTLNSMTKQEDKPAEGGFLFGGGSGTFSFGGASNDKPVFGKPSIFGGSLLSNTALQEPKTVFGGNGASLFGNNTNIPKPVSSIFGNQEVSGENIPPSNESATATEATSKPNTLFGGTGSFSAFGTGGGTLFGNQQSTADASSKFIFGEASLTKPTDEKTNDHTSKENTGPSPLWNVFNSDLSFGAFSNQANSQTTEAKSNSIPPSGFIGLTHTNEFSSFKNTSQTKNDTNNDDNSATDAGNASEHDPYFEPIIALPDEITVSTGEENEDKLFGARSTLYRYDQDKKEWKERGVGELKILQHKTKGTYRLVMRREQIFKLVLNHAVGPDFTFNQMGNNPRCYIWATINFAEEADGAIEKLSVRFKLEEDAKKFAITLSKCIEMAKSRAGLEPEQD